MSVEQYRGVVLRTGMKHASKSLRIALRTRGQCYITVVHAGQDSMHASRYYHEGDMCGRGDVAERICG